MHHINKSIADLHTFYDDSIVVREYNFEDPAINDAEITIKGRYPLEATQ
jgi:hypothetical protein